MPHDRGMNIYHGVSWGGEPDLKTVFSLQKELVQKGVGFCLGAISL